MCTETFDPQCVPAVAATNQVYRMVSEFRLTLSTPLFCSVLHLNTKWHVLRTRLRRLKEMLASRNLCLLSVLMNWIKGTQCFKFHLKLLRCNVLIFRAVVSHICTSDKLLCRRVLIMLMKIYFELRETRNTFLKKQRSE